MKCVGDFPGVCVLVREALQAVSDQARPSGLMAGSKTATRVTVKIFVEEEQVLEKGVAGISRVAPVARAAVRAGQKQLIESPLQFVCDPGKVHLYPGSSRVLNLQLVAVEVMEALQGLDEQVVDWKPDRASPVGISTEHGCCRLGGRVIDAELLAVDMQHVRVFQMPP